MNLRVKFLGTVTILICLCMGASTLISYRYASDALHDSVTQQLTQIADSTARQLGDWLVQQRQDLKNWSTNMVFEAALKEGFVAQAARKSSSEMLAGLKADYKIFESINLADASGVVVASSNEEMLTANRADRKYFQESMAGNSFISEVLKSRNTGQIIFVISAPVRNKENEVAGVLYGSVDLAAFTAVCVETVRVGRQGFAFLMDQQGLLLSYPDKKQILEQDFSKYDFGQKMLKTQNGETTFSFEGEDKISAYRTNPETGWIVAVMASTSDVFHTARQIGYISLGMTCLMVVVIVAALVMLLGGLVVRPLRRAVEMANAVAVGDLGLRLEMTSKDEVGHLASALDNMADNLKGKADIASAIAQGDLDHTQGAASEKDVLGKALDGMVENLNMILGEVATGVDQVKSGSHQVSDSSQSLSQGATEQAASVEEITSSMMELASRTKSNAENAAQANQLSISARGSASVGNAQMQEMISAMNEINESSKEIAKIIKTIDDIAFQTNLLALNAAVEAARAGKHGKGFAVVAQEVRNLAGRSAKAARETAELIDGSVKKVEKGTEIVDKTAQSLKEIVQGTTKVTDLVGEIAAASNEQAHGITQINQGLNQVEQVTQQNTANAEETAAAAEELSSQAARLNHLVSRFKLKGKERGFAGVSKVEHSQAKQLPQAPSMNRWGGDSGNYDSKNRGVTQEDLVPLDDKDFGKF